MYLHLHIFGKNKLSITDCMYGCMDVNRVLNEICTQLGMLRCKIHVVVFLGEPNT